MSVRVLLFFSPVFGAVFVLFGTVCCAKNDVIDRRLPQAALEHCQMGAKKT